MTEADRILEEAENLPVRMNPKQWREHKAKSGIPEKNVVTFNASGHDNDYSQTMFDKHGNEVGTWLQRKYEFHKKYHDEKSANDLKEFQQKVHPGHTWDY